jgi:hypothetical protein
MSVMAPQRQRSSYHHWRPTSIPTPGIDLLASAAEYVQREEERLRKRHRASAPDVLYYRSIPHTNLS